jgi:hypothetical protein
VVAVDGRAQVQQQSVVMVAVAVQVLVQMRLV